jgi:hypothetical protein
MALFGVQGWRWARDVRELVVALDADAARQQQWRTLARQASAAGEARGGVTGGGVGGYKAVIEAWAAGVLTVGARQVSPREVVVSFVDLCWRYGAAQGLRGGLGPTCR